MVNESSSLVEVEFTNGTSEQYVLVLVRHECSWAVGVFEDSDGVHTEAIRLENMVRASPSTTGVVGPYRYFWSDEKRRRSDDSEVYSEPATHMLDLLCKR